MSCRYALYFAPADDSPLAAYGQSVLGRTAETARSADAGSEHPDVARWFALTQSPAHYGFHATLKAPFELAEGKDIQALHDCVEEFARKHPPIALQGLFPRQLAGFTALTLEDQSPELTAFAFQVVRTFEPFRRPLSTADLERRKRQRLTTRQLDLLEKFGYPYVADEFRFHMTLSGPLEAADDDFMQWLQQCYRQQMTDTPLLDRLAIYAQRDRSSAFVRLHGFDLIGSESESGTGSV